MCRVKVNLRSRKSRKSRSQQHRHPQSLPHRLETARRQPRTLLLPRRSSEVLGDCCDYSLGRADTLLAACSPLIPGSEPLCRRFSMSRGYLTRLSVDRTVPVISSQPRIIRTFSSPQPRKPSNWAGCSSGGTCFPQHQHNYAMKPCNTYKHATIWSNGSEETFLIYYTERSMPYSASSVAFRHGRAGVIRGIIHHYHGCSHAGCT